MKHARVIHSDHNEFFHGVERHNLSGTMGNDLLDFFKPIFSQTVANTQASVGTALTNLVNNQLQNNPKLQASTQDKLTETIKNSIMNNKWYILGGIVGFAVLVVVLTRVSQKKTK